MNEEIKKILDYLKNNTFIPDETKRKYKILHRDEVNRLLNYITNLQEENNIEPNIIDEDRLKIILQLGITEYNKRFGE